jgi:hypothetical protein
MRYKQVGIYQNINGDIGRDCNERWEIIKNYIETITGKNVIEEYRVGVLTTNQRSLFVIQ